MTQYADLPEKTKPEPVPATGPKPPAKEDPWSNPAVAGDTVNGNTGNGTAKESKPPSDGKPSPEGLSPAWPDPPAEEAYHGLVGDIVRAIEPHSEADPVALLVQLLVGFGAALGRTAHFLVEGDTHYMNEFVLLVGKTAKGRKGTSWGAHPSRAGEG